MAETVLVMTIALIALGAFVLLWRPVLIYHFDLDEGVGRLIDASLRPLLDALWKWKEWSFLFDVGPVLAEYDRTMSAATDQLRHARSDAARLERPSGEMERIAEVLAGGEVKLELDGVVLREHTLQVPEREAPILIAGAHANVDYPIGGACLRVKFELNSAANPPPIWTISVGSTVSDDDLRRLEAAINNQAAWAAANEPGRNLDVELARQRQAPVIAKHENDVRQARERVQRAEDHVRSLETARRAVRRTRGNFDKARQP